MNQTPKQWATTAFIFVAASAIVVLLSAAPPSANGIRGTIALDPSIAARVHTPAVVYVIARDEAAKGHPILAKRLDVARFPVAFSLGPQDAMMGGTPPARVFLEARIDLDGDAATREPGAPSGSAGSVVMGASGVKLVLK
jgi:hypothetical protein